MYLVYTGIAFEERKKEHFLSQARTKREQKER